MSELVKAHQPCPSCDSTDAYSEYSDGHGWCFSCNKYFRGDKEEVAEYTYQFMPRRGISAEVHRFYNVKAKIAPNGQPLSVGYPYSNGAVKVRIWDKKEFRVQGEDIGKAGLFGKDKFAAGSAKTVTITEGEDDALSLYQVLKSPVVSVQSSGSALRDCSFDISYLRSFDTVYLAFDSDEPGRRAAEQVAKLFDYSKVLLVRFSNRKDATEYIEAGEDTELRNIWHNSKRYLPETVISTLKEFEDIVTKPMAKGVNYPWPTLNKMLVGIRPYESVLICARPGVGKTELMHAIEYQILKETDDAIGSIFLEEPKRDHLKALAGLDLGKPARLPDSDVTDAEVVDAINRIVSRDDRLHIYNHFGSDDPGVLLDTIRFLVSARSCRYILFDHISFAASDNPSSDERRALDHLIVKLEMMVKELGFSLILVSHVNAFGGTRGSALIDGTVDIRIDAERDVKNPDPDIRKILRLTVAKNRPASKTGPAGELIFDSAKHRYYEELDHVQAASDHWGNSRLGNRVADQEGVRSSI